MALDPLDRATHAARDEPVDRWPEVSAAIMAGVRSLRTPSDPIRVHTDGPPARDDDGSHTYVSSRVVVDALRRLLQRDPTHAPAGIGLRVDGDRLAAIELDLVGAYGVDLVGLASRVRGDVLVEVTRLVGADPRFTAADVAIEFVDVVEGDPNLV
ncbi:hypothetical protein [Nocardioides dongxiaopingii]|uniref:hypothetical protein n=1 Tax=Nocardioides dongxiaopingii TaxID=2576036 RepID=UPI0010C763C0|nr:hypothetical protein [Nocardioides dongxiaopingii]